MYQPKRIVENYLRGWFIIDLASSLPIDQFFAGGGSALKLNKLIRLLRMVKLLRLFKLYRLSRGELAHSRSHFR